MKITILSEDHKSGLLVDWPVVPRVGEFVSLKYPGGTLKHRVESVDYVSDEKHALTGATVHLDL